MLKLQLIHIQVECKMPILLGNGLGYLAPRKGNIWRGEEESHPWAILFPVELPGQEDKLETQVEDEGMEPYTREARGEGGIDHNVAGVTGGWGPSVRVVRSYNPHVRLV